MMAPVKLICLICKDSTTVTETHVVIGACRIGGFAPVHIDHEAARRKGLRGPILHGSLTAAIMSKVIGASLPSEGWTFLGQSNEYRAPVYAGYTLTTTRRLVEKRLHTGLAGTALLFEGICASQHGECVAPADAKLLRRNLGSPTPSRMPRCNPLPQAKRDQRYTAPRLKAPVTKYDQLIGFARSRLHVRRATDRAAAPGHVAQGRHGDQAEVLRPQPTGAE